jgi:hypothetical protein
MARFVVLTVNRIVLGVTRYKWSRFARPLQHRTSHTGHLLQLRSRRSPVILANGILRGFVFGRFERDIKTDRLGS